jgi:O-acetyl-ADP-ribose deacetylase (regulator of RNase III)
MAQKRKSNRVAIRLNETQLELIEGDITELDVDAIVNPANEDLELGEGVARAIREKGGASIQKECNRIGGTPVGTAVITGAGDLPHKHVIHAVGPRMGDGDEDRKLAAAVRSSLALADRHGLESVAVPAISTGNFGFPVNRCARVTLTRSTAICRVGRSSTGWWSVCSTRRPFRPFGRSCVEAFDSRDDQAPYLANRPALASINPINSRDGIVPRCPVTAAVSLYSWQESTKQLGP